MVNYIRALIDLCATRAGISARQDGATLVEYGLIIGLIAIGIITLLTTMGTDLETLYTTIQEAISGAASGGD